MHHCSSVLFHTEVLVIALPSSGTNSVQPALGDHGKGRSEFKLKKPSFPISLIIKLNLHVRHQKSSSNPVYSIEDIMEWICGQDQGGILQSGPLVSANIDGTSPSHGCSNVRNNKFVQLGPSGTSKEWNHLPIKIFNSLDFYKFLTFVRQCFSWQKRYEVGWGRTLPTTLQKIRPPPPPALQDPKQALLQADPQDFLH